MDAPPRLRDLSYGHNQIELACGCIVHRPRNESGWHGYVPFITKEPCQDHLQYKDRKRSEDGRQFVIDRGPSVTITPEKAEPIRGILIRD
jgi:hypothetical protein